MVKLCRLSKEVYPQTAGPASGLGGHAVPPRGLSRRAVHFCGPQRDTEDVFVVAVVLLAGKSYCVYMPAA